MKKLASRFVEKILDGEIKFEYKLTVEEERLLRRAKVVVLEGVDNTGKSTMFQQLIDIRKKRCERRRKNRELDNVVRSEVYKVGNFTVYRSWFDTKAIKQADYNVNTCFVKLASHRRVYSLLTKVLSERNFNLKMRGLGDGEGVFRSIHAYRQKMFDFFYADYISTLKKVAKVIKNHNISTLVFDRCWISNYVYNTGFGFIKQSRGIDRLFEKDYKNHHRLFINHLFFFAYNRLDYEGAEEIQGDQQDFYECKGRGELLQEHFAECYNHFYAMCLHEGFHCEKDNVEFLLGGYRKIDSYQLFFNQLKMVDEVVERRRDGNKFIEDIGTFDDNDYSQYYGTRTIEQRLDFVKRAKEEKKNDGYYTRMSDWREEDMSGHDDDDN